MNTPPPVPVQVKAFTLLELLVVIAIIALLAGILLPVASSVMDNAHKVQAKNTALNIVTAVKSFQTDYGVYPVPAGTTADYVFGTSGMTAANLMDVLRANGQSYDSPTGGNLNPRQIVYIEMPSVKNTAKPVNGIGTDGYPYDPWGTTFYVEVDSNYDNGITNPYSQNAGFGVIGTGVIVLSYGKDMKSNANFSGGGADKNVSPQSDDIISWQ